MFLSFHSLFKKWAYLIFITSHLKCCAKSSPPQPQGKVIKFSTSYTQETPQILETESTAQISKISSLFNDYLFRIVDNFKFITTVYYHILIKDYNLSSWFQDLKINNFNHYSSEEYSRLKERYSHLDPGQDYLLFIQKEILPEDIKTLNTELSKLKEIVNILVLKIVKRKLEQFKHSFKINLYDLSIEEISKKLKDCVKARETSLKR